MNEQIVAAIRRLTDPLRRQLADLVTRAVVSRVTEGKGMQLLQVKLLEEAHDGAEHFQPYGFTAVPLAGAEAVMLSAGGFRNHLLIVAVSDRRYRKKDLQPGESALYNNAGAYWWLKTGDVIEGNKPIDLVDGAVVKVAGTQVVGAQGSAVPDSTPTAADVSAKLNLLLGKLRTHGLIAS